MGVDDHFSDDAPVLLKEFDESGNEPIHSHCFQKQLSILKLLENWVGGWVLPRARGIRWLKTTPRKVSLLEIAAEII